MDLNFRHALSLMPHLATGMLLVSTLVMNWRHRGPGRREFLVLQLSVLLWLLGDALEALAAGRSAIRLAKLMGDLGGWSAGPSVLLMAWRLSGRPPLRWPGWLLLVSAPLISTVDLAFDLRWLYLDMHPADVRWSVDFGPLLLPFLLHANIATGLTVLLTLPQIWRGQFSHRMRAITLLGTAMAPWVIYSLVLGHFVRLAPGSTQLFAALCAVILYAVDRAFAGIEISPLARDLVIESMPEGMVVTSLDGRISDFNPAAARMLGLVRADHQRPLNEALATWNFTADGDFPMELGGETALIEASRVVLTRWDQSIGRVFLFRDITGERRMRQDLERASHAALAAARVQSEFLANMSHEIRTPLTGILGMNQLLLRTRLDDEQREFAGIIHSSAESLRVIVNDVLDLSKIEAGLVTLERIPVRLPHLVRELAAMFAETGRAKGVWVVADVAPDFPALVEADPTRLRQILTNLLSNAVKFTPAGRVSVELSCRGDRVWVAVQDCGIGFDESMTERLFERFVQADASTTRHFGGTGLGLAICRHLVEKMGGGIRAASKPDAGARFEFDFPLIETTEPPVAPIAPTSGTLAVRRGRVLVAEDNRVNQKLLVALLRNLHCDAEVVADGVAAAQRASDEGWDCILMDCSMPLMDGYTATERIRAAEQTAGSARIPIIAVTAGALDEDLQRCLQAGMDSVLTKPIHLDELQRTIERYVGVAPAHAALLEN